MCCAGALLGAGGATAYYNGMDGSSLFHHLVNPSWSGTQRWTAPSGKNPELDDLYKLVSRSPGLNFMHQQVFSIFSLESLPCRWSVFPGMCTEIRAQGSQSFTGATGEA